MTGQLTRDDLRGMMPEQIQQARRDGALDDLLAGRHPADPATPTADADQGARGSDPSGRTLRQRLLDGKTPHEIVAMHERGDLDALMRGDA